MADEATPVSETPKKASKGPSKAKKVKPAASHPKISIMVNAAIKDLKERGGSSLQAVKKYISSNYKVDVERLAPFIKKYLKTAVSTGELVQTKGKGASGSFKLKGAGGKAEGNPKSTKAAEKKPKPASPAKRVASKPAKKTSVKKVTKKPKAEKKSKPAKSPKKPKAKAAAKPKPKPKKAAKPAPKKTAAKKGKR